jgi:hypothetical protein
VSGDRCRAGWYRGSFLRRAGANEQWAKGAFRAHSPPLSHRISGQFQQILDVPEIGSSVGTAAEKAAAAESAKPPQGRVASTSARR